MKFSPVFIFIFIILLIQPSRSQTTYFIKYKESVPQSVIAENLRQQKISRPANGQIPVFPQFKVEKFARGLFSENPVIGRIVKVSFDTDPGEEEIRQLMSSSGDIEYFQKSINYRLDYIPDDSLISDQWALSRIKAFEAWDITQGNDSVLVGIIDTGIDYYHPDLRNQIFINEGETGFDSYGRDKSANGIDDDGNGFIDDYRGWDFTDRVGFPYDSTGGDYLEWDNDPFDDHGHGTLISGIAAAQSDNSIGIAGAAPGIKLLNLRAFDPGGYGEEDDVAAAILYAVRMGCKVINMSFGDNAFSYVLRDVIRYAYAWNVILVSSAGNSGSDLPHYPSGYSEVICVGNSTEQDFVAGSSNYGSTVDLVAPGTSIITTSRNSGYSFINGTSASAPFVSAAVALLSSIHNFSNEEVRQILKSTTDDIGTAGWDLRSGAGRLNILKLLSLTAPAAIKFNHPTQDYATGAGSLVINASVLSPYFTSFDLEIGTGLNPVQWESLKTGQTNQVLNEDIYGLDISSFPDTSYTLRLIINQSNGRIAEERVNFHIDRTPPQAELISLIPAFYGDKSTPLASLYTNEPSIVRMYFRPEGETDFRFITLDGFTINNQFARKLHYGFIPKDLVRQNTSYEIYFEAENLVGLRSEIRDEPGFFSIRTSFNAVIHDETVMPYSLPPGSIFERPLDISSEYYNDVILRPDTNPRVSHIYHLNNQSFTLLDSLNERIVKDFGDFNNNGLKDMLTYLVRDGYIDEQSAPNSASFTEKYSNTGGGFWPIFAKDIRGNGEVEVFSVRNDTTIDVWKVPDNLQLEKTATLNNFSPFGYGNNIINSPNAATADIDNDDVPEIWIADRDGDIFCYKAGSSGQFTEHILIETGFLGSSAFLTAGDYDGDGKDEIAVLLHSIEEYFISPFYRLVIFNLSGGELNILFDQAFLDAATEYNSGFRKAENSLRFYDIAPGSGQELVLFTFPYAYIFKYNPEGSIVVSYKENINSNSIFIGDLNNNGLAEIAYPYSDRIEFVEYSSMNSPGIPYNLEGFSISSNTINLNWSGSSSLYYIYRGEDENSFELIDSTAQLYYLDSGLEINKFYYYSLRAFNPDNPVGKTDFTGTVRIFSHAPAAPLSVISNSKNSVIVTFSEKIKNTISNLRSFELSGAGFPNSISPYNQFSYLLTFEKSLPAGGYSLIISGLRDFYNSPVPDDTLNFTVDYPEETDRFYLTNSRILNPYLIELVFNLNVDETSVLNTSNYSFEPDNKVNSVRIDADDKKKIYLDLTNQKPVGALGREYMLRLSGLRSDPASGNISIAGGAGSYLILTSFTDNLSDVFVYPNPVRTGSNENKLTFANLPQKVRITIFSLDGRRISELEENDGNGGLDYDLLDADGNRIATGIYIYRIVKINEVNEEGEEKLGKFAVIR